MVHSDCVPVKESGFPEKLDQVLQELREFLIAKNKAYGNSALKPVRVFSKASPVEQILVRSVGSFGLFDYFACGRKGD